MSEQGLFTIEFYETPDGKSPVEDWLNDLSDVSRDALLAALSVILSHRGIEVCGTEWGKQLGGGLFEFRVRHTAPEIAALFGQPRPKMRRGERVLLRVFCHAYGAKVVLLLGGYDKGRDPSPKRQAREIERARSRLTEFRNRRSRGNQSL